MSLANYIGKGLTFPIRVNSSGGVDLDTGFDLVNSSIKMILSWSSTKIFLSEFQSLIEDLLEEPNDELLKGLVKFIIFDNLTKWETRIVVLETSIDITESDKADISIRYRLKSNNLEEIFVFPFYKKIIY